MSASVEEILIGTQKVLRLQVKENEHISLVEIYFHGAHVTRFEKVGQPPFLFLSERAILDGTKPIRGGIPIIFPQFGNLGNLPTHGFARNMPWNLEKVHSDASQGSVPFAAATFELRSSPSTRLIWQYDFVIEYTVRLLGAERPVLHIDWRVHNLDQQPFQFSCALHTYLAITNIHAAAVVGVAESDEKKVGSLIGVRYCDQLQGRKIIEETETEIRFAAELDRIYLATPAHLAVLDKGADPPRTLHVVKSNLPDAVVWNPWINKSKTMADLAHEDFHRFLCVEAASIQLEDVPNAVGVTLQPQEEWHGSLQLSS